ncbi:MULTISPECIES: flagellar basal-body rod protein FlgG [Nitrincola]|uniref:Flagellar basal-body rod protein FlgG n=1 Tax=Nitrincola nitratireducens TaxID=1229521 RepID=W9UR18_9GAMM|nr:MULTISPECIES: flagellar basal-body rod protein FlgG [Nitrincola]EXJ09529.1 Distal rod protein [Nitrincola nitratireducens]
MHGALHVAKTGLSAQDTNLRVISNNLANVSTVGFKKDRAVFEDLLYQVRRQPGAQNANDAQLPSGLQLGHGVRTVSTQKMFETGDLQITDRTFDLAINGRGFFQVVQPNGDIAYTRNGQFHLNADNQVVTAEGYALEPAIELPGEVVSFSVGVDGQVTVVVAGDIAAQNIGQITLADFVNPEGLLAVGQNLFQETAASGPANVLVAGEDGAGIIKQGMLEGSNVNAVEELVNMITTQRAYEINSKVISTADQMLSFATQQL